VSEEKRQFGLNNRLSVKILENRPKIVPTPVDALFSMLFLLMFLGTFEFSIFPGKMSLTSCVPSSVPSGSHP